MAEEVRTSYAGRLLETIRKRVHCAKDIGDEWETPEAEFEGIERMFGGPQGFSIDLFASEENKKCDLFFTAFDNAKNQDWGKYCKEHGFPLRGFANPPFSKRHSGLNEDGSSCTGLKEIMNKAEAERILGFYSVWLVPNNPEADWFPVETASAVYTITGGRITFGSPKWYRQDPKGSKPSSARGGLCIVIFDPDHVGDGPKLGYISRQELRQKLEVEEDV